MKYMFGSTMVAARLRDDKGICRADSLATVVPWELSYLRNALRLMFNTASCKKNRQRQSDMAPIRVKDYQLPPI